MLYLFFSRIFEILNLDITIIILIFFLSFLFGYFSGLIFPEEYHDLKKNKSIFFFLFLFVLLFILIEIITNLVGHKIIFDIFKLSNLTFLVSIPIILGIYLDSLFYTMSSLNELDSDITTMSVFDSKVKKQIYLNLIRKYKLIFLLLIILFVLRVIFFI